MPGYRPDQDAGYGRDQRTRIHHLMWPGITRGFDSNCTGCCWAMKDGVYQIKLRDEFCLNHGGDLDRVLARMARGGLISGDPVAGEAR